MLIIGLLILLLIIYNLFRIYYKREGFDSNDEKMKIYVISLKREDRLKNIEEQRKKIGDHSLEIFDAIKGDQINIDKLMEDGVISKSWKNGPVYKNREIGCYLSHYYIYNKIVTNKAPGYTIIFEDDFLIKDDHFLENVKNAIKDTNGNFDILFLGNHNNNHGEPIKNNIYYVNNAETLIGTHSYLINNKNIGKIISETENIDMAIDLKLDHLSKTNKLDILVIYPTFVNQGSETSNIRDMSIETFALYNE
jgi:glycosyl transferase family 25